MNTSGIRRWWALGALYLSMLVVGLDATIINIALPTLSTSLHASAGELQWFVDAYSLVFAALLLPAGLLGDRFGRKKLLLLALALFGAASAGCAYAPSATALIAARAVLGLGAAFLTPLSLSVLPVLFSAEERPKAIGVWVILNAISFPIGPILGGWLLSNFWWGSVFLINVPVTVLGLIAVAILVPESRSLRRHRLNLAGLPATLAHAVRANVSAGAAMAHRLGSAALVDSVRTAFVHGMDVMLLVCAGISIVGIVLTLVFLPKRSGTGGVANAGQVQLEHEGVA